MTQSAISLKSQGEAGRVSSEQVRVVLPLGTSELEWGETLDRLEAFAVGIGGQERLKMVFQLLSVGVPVAVHGGFLERPVHSLDLTLVYG